MNVLITGKDSYIGNSLKKHLENSGYNVDVADTFDNNWKIFDFSKYNAVVHVAAIVHDNAKHASMELFDKVNKDLPTEIANFAKESGVKQFVFLSTMGVYGVEKSLKYEQSVITEHTQTSPKSPYGKSKLDAEILLKKMSDENFKVSVVRPPNVYGFGCKGNYISIFENISRLLFICPKAYTNIRQSMIYIDNLSELIKLIISEQSDGVFMPQDEYAPNTVELITAIRNISGKKTIKSQVLGLFIRLLSCLPIVKKLYGGVMYDMSLSDCFESRYRIVPFEKGIELTYKK